MTETQGWIIIFELLMIMWAAGGMFYWTQRRARAEAQQRRALIGATPPRRA
jgi:preprotein translocase subunit YajC